MKSGKFEVIPQGFQGKQFAFTQSEALAYANTSKEYAAIIKATVDESIVKSAHFSKSIDPWIFKNGVVTFDASQMGALNKAIQTVNHVY